MSLLTKKKNKNNFLFVVCGFFTMDIEEPAQSAFKKQSIRVLI